MFDLVITASPAIAVPLMAPGEVVSEPALRRCERRRRVDNDEDEVFGVIIGGAEATDIPESNRSRNARMSSLARSDSSLLPKLLFPISAIVFPLGTPETLDTPPSPTKLLKLLVLDIPLTAVPAPGPKVVVTGDEGATPLAPELLLALDFKLGIALLPFPAAPLRRAAHPIHILSTRTRGSLSGRAEAAKDVLARYSGRENVGGLGFDGDARCGWGVRYAGTGVGAAVAVVAEGYTLVGVVVAA